MKSIGVVIVTFNRIQKLKKTLNLFSEQTIPPKYVIVVDNCSKDGTDLFLREWNEKPESFEKYTVIMEKNMGGSGGFYEGLSKAMTLDAEWIWVSDDDAYPELNALELSERYICQYKDHNISAICGMVLNSNNEISWLHRKNIIKNGLNIKLHACDPVNYDKEYFRIDLFSYVGTILRKSCLQKTGLPEKDYFIWYDDTEHSIRFSRIGDIYCVPAIKITHDEDKAGNNLTWKWYYGSRNEIFTIKKSFSFPYFLFYLLKRSFQACLKLIRKETRECGFIEFRALKDGTGGKLGIHNIYKPGWEPKHSYSLYKC